MNIEQTKSKTEKDLEEKRRRIDSTAYMHVYIEQVTIKTKTDI